MRIVGYTDASVSSDGCFSASIVLSDSEHLKTLLCTYDNLDALSAELMGALQIVRFVQRMSEACTSCIIYTDCRAACQMFSRYKRTKECDPRCLPMLKELERFSKAVKFQYVFKSADTLVPNGILTCHILCKRMRGGASESGMDM